MKTLTALILLAAPLPAFAQETGELVRFVSCPIYRDTDAGRKSGCWLADERESARRFDVTQSPYKPDWNRQVLVEGRISDERSGLCGSPVLDPVRTSILPEPCPRHMIPAEGFPGRHYSLPERNVAPLGVAREIPPGPYETTTFHAFFEFDRAFIVYQYDDYLIDRAVTWIRAAHPGRLIVTGYAATQPVDLSGRTLAERPEVARERAEAVALTLERLLPDVEIETRWETDSQPLDLPGADGLPAQSQRRVAIEAIMD